MPPEATQDGWKTVDVSVLFERYIAQPLRTAKTGAQRPLAQNGWIGGDCLTWVAAGVNFGN